MREQPERHIMKAKRTMRNQAKSSGKLTATLPRSSAIHGVKISVPPSLTSQRERKAYIAAYLATFNGRKLSFITPTLKTALAWGFHDAQRDRYAQQTAIPLNVPNGDPRRDTPEYWAEVEAEAVAELAAATI